MSKILKISATLSLLTLLAACGHTTSDRAISGGLIGAGAGAAGSAVFGGDVGTGALIGAGVGAAGGALTSDRDIDLGRPIWR